MENREADLSIEEKRLALIDACLFGKKEVEGKANCFGDLLDVKIQKSNEDGSNQAAYKITLGEQESALYVFNVGVNGTFNCEMDNGTFNEPSEGILNLALNNFNERNVFEKF